MGIDDFRWVLTTIDRDEDRSATFAVQIRVPCIAALNAGLFVMRVFKRWHFVDRTGHVQLRLKTTLVHALKATIYTW